MISHLFYVAIYGDLVWVGLVWHIWEVSKLDKYEQVIGMHGHVNMTVTLQVYLLP